jgi:protein-S-isoprenylcysteine O-methyltransferase Ste14
MSSNDSGRPPEPPRSHAGTIVVLAIVGLGVIWTYIFFGMSGVGWWVKGGATVVVLALMVAAWIWRQKRTSQQLEVLQRWADESEARVKRKPARRSP